MQNNDFRYWMAMTFLSENCYLENLPSASAVRSGRLVVQGVTGVNKDV